VEGEQGGEGGRKVEGEIEGAGRLRQQGR